MKTEASQCPFHFLIDIIQDHDSTSVAGLHNDIHVQVISYIQFFNMPMHGSSCACQVPMLTLVDYKWYLINRF